MCFSMICNCHDFQSLHYCCYEQIELCFVSQGRVTTAVRRGGQLCCSFVANVLKYLCAKTHTLTAALDQLRVVASSTSNDPGPRSRQHQQIGRTVLVKVKTNNGTNNLQWKFCCEWTIQRAEPQQRIRATQIFFISSRPHEYAFLHNNVISRRGRMLKPIL